MSLSYGHTHSALRGGSASKPDAWWTSEGFGRKRPYSQHSHWRTHRPHTHPWLRTRTHFHQTPRCSATVTSREQPGFLSITETRVSFSSSRAKPHLFHQYEENSTFMPSARPKHSPLCFPILLSQIMIRGTLCSDTMSWHSDLWPAACCTGDLQCFHLMQHTER